MEHIELTEEQQIARHYSACLDSVALLQAGKPDEMSESDWQDTVARNKEHLNIMLAKDFWTSEDLSPLQAASV